MVGPTWLPALLVFAAVALATISLSIAWEWWAEWRRHRVALKRLETAKPGASVNQITPELIRAVRGAEAWWLAALRERFKHLRTVGPLLEQAGLRWSVQRYVILVVGFGIAVGLGLLISTRLLATLPLGFLLGGSLPYLFVRRKKTVRERAFEAQLPEAIELIGRAIRAGHPLSSGFRMVAHEMSEPIAGEFRRVAEEQRFGMPIEESLGGLIARVDLVDVRILCTAILIQREVGGNLAEILDNLSSVIRARFTIRRQLRVYTAQGRLSGYVLATLPIILTMIIYSLNRDYMMVLFTERVGQIALVVAATMQIIGYLWIRRIVDIEI